MAIVLLNENALNGLLVLQAEQEFVGPVLRLGMMGNAGAERRKLRRKGGAQPLWQVRHLLEGFSPAGQNPTSHLARPHGRLALSIHPGAQLGRR
jgi:hypothetical protein